MAQIIKNIVTTVSLLAIVFALTSCEDNFKNIQSLNRTSFFPGGEGENIYLQYVDSGRVKAILVSDKMLDYSNVANQFTEFPEGVHVTFIDKNDQKTTVVADYAISYSKTELIDLQGNVVITTQDGKKLESDQLYYDQKNDWLYTEGKYKASTDKDNFTTGVGIDFDSKLSVIKAQNSYAESIKQEK
ncbi:MULTISPECIES: LPS export ABC transporter periplasmic protein LptC [Myroides]|uniref:LPS export ABC transporter periplasmic protein LptC n=1 Tax=Myroides albus TaxID=2562892 RepID=A0A6I3LCC1_9FLAO|nr:MULTISPECIES: LPS export ABC transporter periplasmic protein LptC [Myroides]MTG97099.1 LPS export ABC transporter periplasmic protein LptC [Myroides albus]MVX36812.1 LPS export ABC transporter periplasmic protein LptC [Myroides sp. LoEW2-1]UVD78478.1 LPS export ABC transporter periplasmic protein LptC [Myroides albus]